MKGLLLLICIVALGVACGGSETTAADAELVPEVKAEVLRVEQESTTLDSINQEILESSEVLDALLREIN